mmetsp:Transcript_50022/g.125662  ORF Transcript_50022/g.125662 Transcript_50022/m.125662 type:complete len:202 (-) Transcript_50022:305-910(-)
MPRSSAFLRRTLWPRNPVQPRLRLPPTLGVVVRITPHPLRNAIDTFPPLPVATFTRCVSSRRPYAPWWPCWIWIEARSMDSPTEESWSRDFSACEVRGLTRPPSPLMCINTCFSSLYKQLCTITYAVLRWRVIWRVVRQPRQLVPALGHHRCSPSQRHPRTPRPRHPCLLLLLLQLHHLYLLLHQLHCTLHQRRMHDACTP